MPDTTGRSSIVLLSSVSKSISVECLYLHTLFQKKDVYIHLL